MQLNSCKVQARCARGPTFGHLSKSCSDSSICRLNLTHSSTLRSEASVACLSSFPKANSKLFLGQFLTENSKMVEPRRISEIMALTSLSWHWECGDRPREKKWDPAHNLVAVARNGARHFIYMTSCNNPNNLIN